MLVLYKQALMNLGVPEVEKLTEEMADILKDGIIPYDEIGRGCFKEVFDMNNGFVLKFCSENNPTDREAEVLYAAEEEGVSDIFLPTQIMPIVEAEIPIEVLDDSYEEYDEETGEYIMAPCYALNLMVQPKIYNSVDDSEAFRRPIYWEEKAYLLCPLKYSDGTIVPHNMAKQFYNLDWTQSVIDYYGDKFFDKLLDFISEQNIHDLHDGNIGYIKDDNGNLRPCILDWLS